MKQYFASIWTLALGALFSANVCSATEFKVTVIHPDGEEKTYRMEQDIFPVKLGKSTWSCKVTKAAPKKMEQTTVYGVELFCNVPNNRYSAGIRVGCIPNGPEITNALHLIDARSDEYYRVVVTCIP